MKFEEKNPTSRGLNLKAITELFISLHMTRKTAMAATSSKLTVALRWSLSHKATPSL